MAVSKLSNQRDLICEELVRQIAWANRWSAKVEAWQALLSVKRMADQMLTEEEKDSGPVETLREAMQAKE